jgi:trigger factor
MEATVAEAGTNRITLTITVDANEVSARRNELIDRYGSQVRLKGFRPGKKPPRSLVEKRLGKALEEETNQGLIQEAFDKGVQDNELKPIGPISIDESSAEKGAGIRHVVTFEVRPAIDLPEAASISITPIDTEASDDEVSEELDGLRRRAGNYDDLDGETAVAKDDVITLSGTITAGEETVKDVQDLQHLIGGYPLLGLEADQVISLTEGKAVAAELSFDTTLPEGFTPAEWAGKEATVSLTIQSARRLVPAELNEEFFGKLGVSSEEELRERITQMISGRKQEQAQEAQGEELMDALVAQTSFELPAQILENMVTNKTKEAEGKAKQAAGDGEPEAVDGDAISADSEKELRRYLLVEALADHLDVKATRQDLDQQIAIAAYQTGQTPEEVTKKLQESGQIQSVVGEIRANKAIALMLQKVNEANGSDDAGTEEAPAEPAAEA